MVNTSLFPIDSYPEDDAEQFSDYDNFSEEDSVNQEWKPTEDYVHVGVYSDNISTTEESKEVPLVKIPFVRPSGLSECLGRWNGLADKYALEDFLLYVYSYKLRYDISDEEAIRDLHFLFEGRARTWWQNTEVKPRTWTELLVLMRRTFGNCPELQER